MAPVGTRRSQIRKKEASIRRGNATNYVTTQIIRESKQFPKVTCFFDESLLACDICLEVMHNAMNVSPCNHKFCAGCIYEWNSLNTKCPKCRWSVADITRDTTLNSIIDQYLISFPEKRRDAAQLIELDERELAHLEKWERKRDTSEADVEYDIGVTYESDESDTFEPLDEQLEESNEDGSPSDRTISGSWSENDDTIGSYDDDDGDEGDSDIQDEYISRRNLEKARMEKLRREKEERERLKEMEERSRRTNITSKKEKRRGLRCNSGTTGRNSTLRSTSQVNYPNPSAPSVRTRSMTRRLFGR